jgi:PAS domain S-box-containing protein
MTSGRELDTNVVDALEESEERYRFLTESIPVQIWTALPDGRLDYVSNQTAHSLGLTAPQLLADGWQHVVHPDDLPLAVERWTRALATGNDYEIEFRLRTRDGQYAWHLARAVPQRSASGAILRWFGTNTNIEEQRAQQRRVEMLLADGRLRETWLATTL